MPSGAKKRKALKKKKEQESIGISKGDNDNGNNFHVNISGNDNPESQDDKESDSSLSSPGSQRNEEVGKRDPSAFEKDTVKEKIESSDVDPVKPVVSTSDVVISDKNEQAESSTGSDLVKQESGNDEQKLLPRVEKEKDDNVVTPSEPAETISEAKTVVEAEVPECSEEKHLLASGPPVRRTSWLSCCGLFEVMTGSER